jgi:hypothetical protein
MYRKIGLLIKFQPRNVFETNEETKCSHHTSHQPERELQSNFAVNPENMPEILHQTLHKKHTRDHPVQSRRWKFLLFSAPVTFGDTTSGTLSEMIWHSNPSTSANTHKTWDPKRNENTVTKRTSTSHHVFLHDCRLSARMVWFRKSPFFWKPHSSKNSWIGIFHWKPFWGISVLILSLVFGLTPLKEAMLGSIESTDPRVVFDRCVVAGIIFVHLDDRMTTDEWLTDSRLKTYDWRRGLLTIWWLWRVTEEMTDDSSHM